MNTDPDEALVRSSKAGDRVAFEELVRRTSQLLFARLYLETGDTHRAEDLVQETFLTAYRSLHQLTDPNRFRPWLLKIAQNMAIDASRRELRKKRAGSPALHRAMDSVVANRPTPDEGLVRKERQKIVLSLLRSLPEEYRMPLTLRYIGGADYETICLQLGLTNGSLRGLLHRGLKLLRNQLPADFAEEYGGGGK
jgi:RNA polymerase sigma-70 factor (ECF subfamily)